MPQETIDHTSDETKQEHRTNHLTLPAKEPDEAAEALLAIMRSSEPAGQRHHTMDSWAALQAWAIACVSREGEILYATAQARSTLNRISDPNHTWPIQKLDKGLMKQIIDGLRHSRRTGVCTRTSQDGEHTPYTMFIKSMDLNGQKVFSLMLIEGDFTPKT